MSMKKYIGTQYESNILPAIPPGAQIASYSKVNPNQLGKIPGKLGSEGWSGFTSWSSYASTAQDLANWEQWNANISLNCRNNFVGIDIDSENPEFISIVISTIAAFIGTGLPERSRTNSLRVLLVALASGVVAKRALKFVNEATGEIAGLDILASVSQFIIEGTHPTGGTYQWLKGDLSEYMEDDLPKIDQDLMDTFLENLIKRLAAARWVVTSGNSVGNSEFRPTEVQVYEARTEHVDITKLKGIIPNDIITLVQNGVPQGRRSEAVASVVANLIGLGIDDNTIADILLNPDNGISSKCIEQGEAWTMGDIARMRGKFQSVQTAESNKVEFDALAAELNEDAIESRIKLLEKDAKVSEIDAICSDLAKLTNNAVVNRLSRLIKKQSGMSINDVRELIASHKGSGDSGDDDESVGNLESGEVTHNQLALRHRKACIEQGISEVAVGSELFRLGNDFVWEHRSTSKLIVEMCAHMDGEDGFTRRSDYNSVQKQYLDIINDEEFFAERPLGFAFSDSYFYSVKDKQLHVEPLEAKHRQTWKGNYAPDNEVDYSNIMAFLNKALDNGDAEGQIRSLCEAYGIALVGYTTQMQFSMYFYGAPASGKSVLNDLLCSVFPSHTITAVQPQYFDNEYYLMQFFDAAVNQVTELEGDKIWGEKYKQLADGSLIIGRHPAGKPVSFRNRSLMIMNGNELPNFKDKTDAMIRRLKLWEFPNTVPVDERDPMLLNKLREELPGFMYYCLSLVNNVLARSHLEESETSKRLSNMTQERSNNVLDFLADTDVMERNDHSVIPTKTVYELYKGRCKVAGVKPYGKHNFLGILRSVAEVARTKHKDYNPSGSECLRGYRMLGSAFNDCGVSNLNLPSQFSLLKTVGGPDSV